MASFWLLGHRWLDALFWFTNRVYLYFFVSKKARINWVVSGRYSLRTSNRFLASLSLNRLIAGRKLSPPCALASGKNGPGAKTLQEFQKCLCNREILVAMSITFTRQSVFCFGERMYFAERVFWFGESKIGKHMHDAWSLTSKPHKAVIPSCQRGSKEDAQTQSFFPVIVWCVPWSHATDQSIMRLHMINHSDGGCWKSLVNTGYKQWAHGIWPHWPGLGAPEKSLNCKWVRFNRKGTWEEMG